MKEYCDLCGTENIKDKMGNCKNCGTYLGGEK